MRTGLPIADADRELRQIYERLASVLDDTTIADLPATEISQMAGDELVRVIRAARLPLLRTARGQHLEFYDRKTLERLVYLARRCCQNRTTASPSRRTVVLGGE